MPNKKGETDLGQQSVFCILKYRISNSQNVAVHLSGTDFHHVTVLYGCLGWAAVGIYLLIGGL